MTHVTSLVLELQRDAADGSKSLPDVLRKARMVAVKLKLKEMNEWIEHELHGYPSAQSVPKYRRLRGDVRAHNPYNGALIPVRFQDAKLQERLSSCNITQSIGSLFEVANASGDHLQVPFSEQQMSGIREMLGEDDSDWLLPFRRFTKPELLAIFDAVRNRILDWTLELEAAGVLGEGMTFSPEERERAASMTSIQIGSVENFQGVIGTVSNSTMSIDNVSGVDRQLLERGLSVEQRAEVQEIIAVCKASKPEGRIAAAKRGIQWVVEHAEKLGTLAGLFRDYFGKYLG